MTAISSSGPPAPRRMMEPLPNCRSICAIANSSACRRSLFASAMRVSLFSDVVQCSVTLFSDVREHSMLRIILGVVRGCRQCPGIVTASEDGGDRKSTRLNSSHVSISYAVFCLKKKKKITKKEHLKNNNSQKLIPA